MLVELLRLLAVGRPAVGAVLAGLFRVVTETGLEIDRAFEIAMEFLQFVLPGAPLVLLHHDDGDDDDNDDDDGDRHSHRDRDYRPVVVFVHLLGVGVGRLDSARVRVWFLCCLTSVNY